ncbi:MAG: DUF6364 family protein [Luteolibacter sp.]
MKSRVTITLDPQIHRLAKQAASRKHTTVSGLIESLLEAETERPQEDLVATMTGISTLRAPAPGSDPLYDALQAKYARE